MIIVQQYKISPLNVNVPSISLVTDKYYSVIVWMKKSGAPFDNGDMLGRNTQTIVIKSWLPNYIIA